MLHTPSLVIKRIIYFIGFNLQININLFLNKNATPKWIDGKVNISCCLYCFTSILLCVINLMRIVP